MTARGGRWERLALRLLGIRHIHCSAINTGSGTVNTEHGVLPVPAPATARLLEGKPVYARGPALELTTPFQRFTFVDVPETPLLSE